MVLEAFWRGDKDELRELCDDDVYEGFAAAIDAREAAGETLDNRLIRIEDATIDAAELDGQTARIAVRFVADIAAVTRDKDGNVDRRLARRCDRERAMSGPSGATSTRPIPTGCSTKPTKAERRLRGAAGAHAGARADRCCAACGAVDSAASHAAARPAPPTAGLTPRRRAAADACSPGVRAGPAIASLGAAPRPMPPARSPPSAKAARSCSRAPMPAG